MKTLILVLWVVGLSFMAQAQFRFITNNGSITITGYTGPGVGSVNIPSATNGYPVTSIGDYAFQFDAGISSVVIPDSVTNIGIQAFDTCESLTNVEMGDGVTTIGDERWI